MPNIAHLLHRQNQKCFFCGKKIYLRSANLLPLATVEHLIPVSRGGENTNANCRAACKECNQRKGNKTLEEFKNHLKNTIRDYSNILENIEK